MTKGTHEAIRPQYLWRFFKSSPFLKHNFIFLTGSLGVSVLNYLFYPVLSHMLKPADFGEVQTLTSLFTQAAIFYTALNYVTIHVTINIADQEERNRTLLGLERIAMLGSYALLIIALLFVEKLRDFLHFSQVWPFVALIAALAISIPLAFRMSFLRGYKQFFKAVLIDGIGSTVKLILAPIFVLLGWRSLGAIIGLALSQVVSLVLGVFWAYRAGFSGFGLSAKVTPLAALKPQLRHAFFVFLALGCITMLQTLDVVTIKHYFSPAQAGLYAGVTTVASIIFFLVAPITGVLVASVNLKQPPQKNSLRLKSSLLLMLSLGGSVLAIMALVPSLIIKILVGSKYLTYAHYLPRIGLLMLLLATASAIMMYHIALNRYSYSFIAIFALILTLCLIHFKHAAILVIINDLLVGSAALLAIIVFQSLLLQRNVRKEVNE